MTWFNPVVLFFGGRTGWLGPLYSPTILEQADERHRELERRRLRLDLEQQQQSKELKKIEARIKRQWKAGRTAEARQAIADLRRARVDYSRLGHQRANVAAVAAKIQQLRSGTATEDALEFYVRAMSERMATAHPQRFAHVLARCAQLKDMSGMTGEMLDEFFADEEQEERDRDGDAEKDEEAIVTAILVELKLVQGIEQAPSLAVVSELPPPSGPGGGSAVAAVRDPQRHNDDNSDAGGAPMLLVN